MSRRRPLSVAAAIAAGVLVAGCGGGASPSGASSSPGAANSGPGRGSSSSRTTSTTATAVARADAVSLLPTATEVTGLVRATSTPTRYDQVLNADTLNSSFATATSQAMGARPGAAELDVTGRPGTYLYIHVFVFKTIAAAKALGSDFLSTTRLSGALTPPSNAPGQQRTASVQPYCAHKCLSYRYAFRDQNVLSYVELDGPRGKYSLADAIRIAHLTDGRIRQALA